MPRSSVGTSTGDVCRRFRPPEPCWLADALAELAEIDDEIAEENLPEVSSAMKAEAERILRAVARRAPARPSTLRRTSRSPCISRRPTGRTPSSSC